jgi:hypothetical protein
MPLKTLAKQTYRTIVPPGLRIQLAIAREDFQARQPILVYSIGKVGSLSLYHSIQAAGINAPVYHVHSLSAKRIASVKRFLRSRGATAAEHRYLHVGNGLRRRLVRPSSEIWYLITGVRDPIARALSETFQTLYLTHKDHAGGSWTPESLGKVLADTIAPERGAIRGTLNWFESEFRESVGINVFDYPFDRRMGYSIIEHENFKVLLYRVESLNSVFSNGVLKRFLEVDRDLQPVRRNVAEDKTDGLVYQKARAEFRLPRQSCELIYSSRLAKHFYSDEMIEQFIQRWSA